MTKNHCKIRRMVDFRIIIYLGEISMDDVGGWGGGKTISKALNSHKENIIDNDDDTLFVSLF